MFPFFGIVDLCPDLWPTSLSRLFLQINYKQQFALISSILTTYPQTTPLTSFTFIFKIVLYWIIVNLLCCVICRYTAKGSSCTHTHIHPFQILFPYRLLQKTQFPVLQTRSLSVIYFLCSSVYMLIPKS